MAQSAQASVTLYWSADGRVNAATYNSIVSKLETCAKAEPFSSSGEDASIQSDAASTDSFIVDDDYDEDTDTAHYTEKSRKRKRNSTSTSKRNAVKNTKNSSSQSADSSDTAEQTTDEEEEEKEVQPSPRKRLRKNQESSELADGEIALDESLAADVADISPHKKLGESEPQEEDTAVSFTIPTVFPDEMTVKELLHSVFPNKSPANKQHWETLLVAQAFDSVGELKIASEYTWVSLGLPLAVVDGLRKALGLKSLPTSLAHST